MPTIAPVKITALFPGDLVNDLQATAGKETLTESLKLAVEYYIRSQKFAELTEKLKKKPLKFRKGFTAENVRQLSRRKRW